MFHYNLQASRASICPNLAVPPGTEPPASMYGVFKCSTHKFGDVIRAAGGIQILLPLLLRLEVLDDCGASSTRRPPAVPGPGQHINHGSHRDRWRTNIGHSSSVAVPALKALKALLVGNPRNQADFHRMYARGTGERLRLVVVCVS